MATRSMQPVHSNLLILLSQVFQGIKALVHHYDTEVQHEMKKHHLSGKLMEDGGCF